MSLGRSRHEEALGELRAAVDWSKHERMIDNILKVNRESEQEKAKASKDLSTNSLPIPSKTSSTTRFTNSLPSRRIEYVSFPLWEGLNLSIDLIDNLRRMGYKAPSPILKAIIEQTEFNWNLLTVLPLYIGKTLGYAIPAVNAVLKATSITLEESSSRAAPLVIVIVPSTELLIQVFEIFMELAKGRRVYIRQAHDKIPSKDSLQQIQEGCHILIITPERLFDLYNYLSFHVMKMLVFDEADIFCANVQKGKMLHYALANRLTPEQFQCKRIFTAVTFNNEYNRSIDHLTGRHLQRGGIAQVTLERKFNPNNYFTVIETTKRLDRYMLLNELIHRKNDNNQLKKTVVFANKPVCLEICSTFMRHTNMLVLHENVFPAQQEKIIKLFNKGEHKLLIATDIFSRGPMIMDLEQMICFGLPDYQSNGMEVMFHRMGRCGPNTKAIVLYDEDSRHDRASAPQFVGLLEEENITVPPFLEKYKSSPILTSAPSFPAIVSELDLLSLDPI